VELTPILLGQYIFAALVGAGLGLLAVALCYALCVILLGLSPGEKPK